MSTNYGKIKLIKYTPEPIRVISTAAKMCIKPGTGTELFSQLTNDQLSLVQRLSKRGHLSVLEHTYFTFSFEDISVYAEQFIIEFRLASYTVKSRRYVDFGKSGTITPKSIANQPQLMKKYKNHVNYLFSEYDFLCSAGLAKEDARFVLPYGFKSNFICSMNLRELLYFIDVCLNGRGSIYDEIKDIGKQTLVQLEQVIPNIFESHIKKHPTNTTNIRQLLDESNLIDELKSSAPQVELLDYTEDAEQKLAKMVAFSELALNHEQLNYIVQKHEKQLLEIALSSERQRELEHFNFTFRINGISLPILTHFTRHRIQSLSISSLLTNGISDQHIVPPKIKQQPELLARYEKVFTENKTFYNFLAANGIPAEDLVYLYLSGNVASIITTMNARQLIKFFSLRCCKRAQWEIRGIANKMLAEVRSIYPNIFNGVGAGCFTYGTCPEGEHGCGNPINKKI